MRKRPRRDEVLCSLCGNAEDLAVVDGQQLCSSCCTCPHGRAVAEEICGACLREYHTVWTFVGPVIANLVDYYRDGEGLDTWVGGWNFAEEEVLNELARSQGRGAGSASPPGPLLHHHSRGE